MGVPRTPSDPASSNRCMGTSFAVLRAPLTHFYSELSSGGYRIVSVNEHTLQRARVMYRCSGGRSLSRCFTPRSLP